MSQGRELFALDWVKGEILGALEQARQALEAYAEFGEDETRMRTCLTQVHQVHGSLVMLELKGVALLADHLERLAQELLNGRWRDKSRDDACQLLMQGILELPVRLERIEDGGEDSEAAVLGFVNRCRALLSLELMARPALIRQVAGEAALDRFERIDGRGKIRRIRAAYQNVLLGLLKGQHEPHFIDTLQKVAVGLERICQDTPAQMVWESFGEFVESLRSAPLPLSADVIRILRRVDAEIRRFAQDGADAILAPVPERLLKQLLDSVLERGSESERLQTLRKRLEPEADEQVIASGREALVAASHVLMDELTSVKDQLDLLVRGDAIQGVDLEPVAPTLRRIASTCAVLGLENSHLIVEEQVRRLERLVSAPSVERDALFGIAASLLQVEENLNSVNTLRSGRAREDDLSDAAQQVLLEARAALGDIKQAVVNFVGNEFLASYLDGTEVRMHAVSGALSVIGLERPAALLEDCRAFLADEIRSYSKAEDTTQWERLDRFADCLSGIDYHLERLGEGTQGKAGDILDVVERNLLATGFLGRGKTMPQPAAEPAARDAEPSRDADALSGASGLQPMDEMPVVAGDDAVPVEVAPAVTLAVAGAELPGPELADDGDAPVTDTDFEAFAGMDALVDALEGRDTPEVTDPGMTMPAGDALVASARTGEHADADLAPGNDGDGLADTTEEAVSAPIAATTVPAESVMADMVPALGEADAGEEALMSPIADEPVQFLDAPLDETAPTSPLDSISGLAPPPLEAAPDWLDLGPDIAFSGYDEATGREPGKPLTAAADDPTVPAAEYSDQAASAPADGVATEVFPEDRSLECVDADAGLDAAHTSEPALYATVGTEDDSEAPGSDAESMLGEFDLSSDAFANIDEQAAPAPAASEDDDEEIREVFTEEAGEVLEALEVNLQRLSADVGDAEALRELRRGFHTLKGSGRIVQATEIGELAWAVENMLNRVIDGTVPIRPEIVALARQAKDLMPAMLAAFVERRAAPGEMAANIIDNADILASGGSLGSNDDDVVDLTSDEEERRLFLDEAREYVALLRAKTGRRRVHLDEELLMGLHTFVGSVSLLMPGVVSQLVELLYEIGRAANLQVLRGPNVEVDIARLLQSAAQVLEATFQNFESHQEQHDDALDDLLATAHAILANADESPAEEMLHGLTHLHIVLDARESFEAWHAGTDASAFHAEFKAALQAILGATFRPQITDIAKALLNALVPLDPHRAISGVERDTLVAACDRLLEVIDAISAEQVLPRVDEVVTALGDLSSGLLPGADGSASAPSDSGTPTLLSMTSESVPSAMPAEPSTPALPDGRAPIDPAVIATLEREARQMDPELADVFFEEAEELLEALDASVQEFVGEPRNGLHLENTLRGLHTLKGSARLAGLAKVGDRVHQLESEMSVLQYGDPPDKPVIVSIQRGYDEVSAYVQRVRDAFREPVTVTSSATTAAEPAIVPIPVAGRSSAAAGTGEETAAAAPVASRPIVLSRSAVTDESTGDALTAGGAQDMIRVRAGLLENLVNLAGESSILRARVEQGINEFTLSLEEMETTIVRLREQLRRLEMETEAQVLFRTEVADRRHEHFDPLEMDRYSQLQQLSRALSESASDMLDLKDTLLFKSREAETILLQQARVNTELQEGLMRTRMVPFSRLVPRLRRIVRQIATEVGKDVEFHTTNAEGELDRNLLERMVPPLEHMLRNAVDHGIEATSVRRSFGKPLQGRIDLRLSREAGDIVIEIADDGMGIDVEAVRAKAMERGLLRSDARLSDEEVLEFILAPGFSTAKAVTQISGRGVGLDVVNSEVKQLGGSVSISSMAGKGTRFVLRVPFTVSVNRALMVTVGEDQYAVPLNTIEGIVLLDGDQLDGITESDDKLFDYAGINYRVRYLGTYLGRELSTGRGTSGVPLVLVRSGDQAIAVAVDSVLGSREIVVKSLGPQFAGVGGISGATILGDGSVVVILDLVALIRSHGRQSLAPVYRDVAAKARPRCVMVVDDSVTVRKVTSRLLERQGLEVIVAKDGVEAMALLSERTPDIMLLDIEMPRMDGFEVARQVRHDSRTSTMPIVMISSRTGDKHQEHAAALGVNRFLGKPFQESELLAAIDELAHGR